MFAAVYRRSRVPLFCTVAALFATPLHAGEVPHAVAHQGRLLDANGDPLTGTYTLHFELFSSLEGGTSVWDEEQTVTVSNGHYATLLGVETPLALDDVEGASPYVQVSIDDVALSPRQPLNAVPFALQAGTAHDLALDDGGTLATLLDEVRDAARGPRTWDVHKTDTAYVNSSEGWVDIPDLRIEVQPESTEDSFDIAFYVHAAANDSNSTNQGQPGFRITRDGQVLVVGDTAGNRLSTHASIPAGAHDGHSGPDGPNSMINFTGGRVMDSPGTTDPVVYQLQWRSAASHSAVLNRSRTDGDGLTYQRPVSSLHVQQVRRMN